MCKKCCLSPRRKYAFLVTGGSCQGDRRKGTFNPKINYNREYSSSDIIVINVE